jgi:hypothetical protein
MKRTLKSIFLVLTFSLSLSCRDGADEEPSSSTKTLDNFAGPSFSINDCGPNQNSNRVPSFIKGADAFKETVKKAYGAVPRNLHNVVFKTNGGIVVGSDNKCSNALTSVQKTFAGEDGLGGEGCWKQADGKVSLFLPKNKKWIKHSTLRLSGYVYSELIGNKASGSSHGSIKSAAAVFRAQRKRVAQAFITDMGGASKLDERMKKLAGSGTKDFGNYVLAETIDSYYCNQKTNSSFRKNFPKTFNAFSSGKNNLRQDLGAAFWQ